MKNKFIKFTCSFIFGIFAFASVTVALALFLYLKVLPYAVSNDKVINTVQDVIKKSFDIDVAIKQPKLETSLSSDVKFGVADVNAFYNNNMLLDVKDFNLAISLKDIFNKNIIVNSANSDFIFVNVNKITDLPILKTKKDKTKKSSEFKVDIFSSIIDLKQIKILYDIDKNTHSTILLNNVLIDDKMPKKQIKFNVNADITKAKKSLNITTSDNNGVYIVDNKKIILSETNILVNKSLINLSGEVDKQYNYKLKLKSKNFKIQELLSLLDTNIIENNISKQLVYFKNLDGKFNFDINVNNSKYNGNVDFTKLSFLFEPVKNLPIILTSGHIKFDEKNMILKDFNGFYGASKKNSLKFSGTVNDYLKSLDMNINADAIVTNDFFENYLSKMIGYKLKMKGIANTRLMVKSKYNKYDLVWLYMFKKGNGFIIDGEESFMNNVAERVLVSKMHFENMLLNLKSLDYYAENHNVDRTVKKIPIISMNGNIDFSNGKTFVKDFGLELSRPMPSGFINMLIKQQFFKKGTFTGYIKLINTGKYPVLQGKMLADKVAIPSQRLFIKSGEFITDDDHMHISANGGFRRSKFELSGTIMNEIKFPIVVKNVSLSVDKIDIAKYLEIFNHQNPTEAATDISSAVQNSINNGITDENDDSVTPSFDLANIIVEECVLKVAEGFYKDINFANVVANMSLDKNSLLKISSNRFDIANGVSSAKIECDLRKHLYNIKLGIREVDSNIIATSLLNLSKEISGKASGFINLNTDDTLKLNGSMKFRIKDGSIEKIGLVQYIMNVASLFRNPLAMITPSTLSSLVNVPKGNFDKITGEITLKNNVVYPLKIKSYAPLLSSYIIGTYDIEKQDASLRIYTKFTTKKNGAFGLLRSISLNTLANKIPLTSKNDSNYYASEISEIPELEVSDKDAQIFLTKVDGDIEHNNFLSYLKRIK